MPRSGAHPHAGWGIVRGRSEIAALHGAAGQLEAATLRDGERIPLSFLFLFLFL